MALQLQEHEEALLTRYLLGDQIGEELDRIEERFFADDEHFEAICALEDALIDDYVCDRLAPPQRKQFEDRLSASIDWQQRVDFSRGLMQAARSVRDQAGVRSRWRLARLVGSSRRMDGQAASYAALAAACLAIAITGVLAVKTQRLSALLDNSQRERELLQQNLSTAMTGQRERADQLADQLRDAQQQILSLQSEQSSGPVNAQASQRTAAARPLIVSFALVPGLVRGGSLPTLVVPGGAGVRLQLDVPDDYPRPPFRALLEDSAQRQVWGGDILSVSRSPGPAAIVQLTPGLLIEDEYTLVITPVRGTAQPNDLSYHFSVVLR